VSLSLDKSSWKQVTVGDVVRNVNQTVRDSGEVGIDRIIAMEHMDPGELKISRWGLRKSTTTFTRRVTPGQTLFGKRRAYQRKVAYAEFDALCSGDIYTFEADETQMLGDFLPFLVQSNEFFNHALGTSAGSLSPRTNWRDLANFKFDLPPLGEQRRIADLLWAIESARLANAELRSRLRSTRSAYLDSFVKAATRRAPTRDFAHSDWQPVQVGPFGGSLASRHFTESGVRVMKIQNVTNRGQVDLDYSVFISHEHAKSLERYRVIPGDTLIVAQGATVGKTAYVSESVGEAVISQHLIRVRLDPDRVMSRFVSLMIQSADFQRQIDTVRTKSTRDGLNTVDVANFEIPDAPSSSQSQVVSAIDRLEFSEAAFGAEAQRLDALGSSVLTGVFGGS
jgi:type I restriction enzyme, S subunit